jgi:hypothetical protein
MMTTIKRTLVWSAPFLVLLTLDLFIAGGRYNPLPYVRIPGGIIMLLLNVGRMHDVEKVPSIIASAIFYVTFILIVVVSTKKKVANNRSE